MVVFVKTGALEDHIVASDPRRILCNKESFPALTRDLCPSNRKPALLGMADEVVFNFDFFSWDTNPFKVPFVFLARRLPLILLVCRI